MGPAQRHRNFIAFAGHRLSGLALAVFLPFHFLALGLVLDGTARLDGFLSWTDQPIVRLAEWGLVVLLIVHFGFGSRLLLVEFSGRGRLYNRLVPAVAGLAVLAGIVFAVKVF